MNNELNTVEDIDAMLDSQFNITEEEPSADIEETDGNVENYYYEQDLTGPIALVIGSEGTGMNRLVSENCDILVKIPMKGKITSLNASVSAGIVTYEIVKQRKI